MDPSSQEEPQQVPRRTRYCALRTHLLKAPNLGITDPRLLKLAKSVNFEIRRGDLMCLDCYNNLLSVYCSKLAYARLHKQRHVASDDRPELVDKDQDLSEDASDEC